MAFLMSTRTIFFVAPAGEALTMALPAGLLDVPKVESKNIDPATVGDLDFLTTGNREREPICRREEEQLVVFRLDEELVDALAELDDRMLPGIADEWGIDDAPGTMALLTDLRELAQTAKARDEELFLYF
jgi:hypothetical protein